MSIRLEQNGQAAALKGPPKIISGNYIKGRQRQHVLLYNVIPLIGVAIAIALLWWFPIGPVEIGLLVGMWALAMIGMSAGLHRYFAHRAFQTNQTLRVILAILGCMAAQGPLISWVAVHRRHHEFSDKQGDPHSPNLHGGGFLGTLTGLWHAQVGWLLNHEYPNPVYYAPDLVRDKALAKINQHYVGWVILGLLIPTAIGGFLYASLLGALQGFLWGGLVRMFVVDNSILCINSFSHVYGRQPFDAGDNSRNNAWIALPTFGESWQNNHHAFASSARIGLEWWQIDMGYWLIWILEKAGMVWDVRVPTREMIHAKQVR